MGVINRSITIGNFWAEMQSNLMLLRLSFLPLSIESYKFIMNLFIKKWELKISFLNLVGEFYAFNFKN